MACHGRVSVVAQRNRERKRGDERHLLLYSRTAPMSAVDVFVAVVPHSESVPDLAARLDALYATGRAAWPGLALMPEAFARHLGAVTRSESDVGAALDAMRPADFYIAAACAFRVAGAETAFAKKYLGKIPAYVASIDPSPAFGDEVTQELSTRLFVPEPGGVAKIALYTGRGAVEGFLRSTAANIARNLKRAPAMDRLGTTQENREPARDLDPEVLLLKKRFAAEFDQAFAATVAQLTSDERKVLKLHYLNGLSIDDVGTACNVSRATAARWLAKARTRIIQLTYKSFATAAGPSSASPESMLALIKSELGAAVAKSFDSQPSPRTDK